MHRPPSQVQRYDSGSGPRRRSAPAVGHRAHVRLLGPSYVSPSCRRSGRLVGRSASPPRPGSPWPGRQPDQRAGVWARTAGWCGCLRSRYERVGLGVGLAGGCVAAREDAELPSEGLSAARRLPRPEAAQSPDPPAATTMVATATAHPGLASLLPRRTGACAGSRANATGRADRMSPPRVPKLSRAGEIRASVRTRHDHLITCTHLSLIPFRNTCDARSTLPGHRLPPSRPMAIPACPSSPGPHGPEFAGGFTPRSETTPHTPHLPPQPLLVGASRPQPHPTGSCSGGVRRGGLRPHGGDCGSNGGESAARPPGHPTSPHGPPRRKRRRARFGHVFVIASRLPKNEVLDTYWQASGHVLRRSGRGAVWLRRSCGAWQEGGWRGFRARGSDISAPPGRPSTLDLHPANKQPRHSRPLLARPCTFGVPVDHTGRPAVRPRHGDTMLRPVDVTAGRPTEKPGRPKSPLPEGSSVPLERCTAAGKECGPGGSWSRRPHLLLPVRTRADTALCVSSPRLRTRS